MKVFLGTPLYSNACLSDGWANSVYGGCKPGGPVNKLVVPEMTQSSLLPLGYNKLWMQAVLGGADVFAMLHADICAEPGWLDRLVTLLDKMSATFVSAGVRIKDTSGDFSAALDLDPKSENPFCLRRLNLSHLRDLPQTYSRHDLAKAMGVKEYGALLLNTGCCVIDLRGTWTRCTPFQIRAQNDWDDCQAYCESEDWYFSRLVHRLGLAAYGTQLVRTQHLGAMAFDSHESLG